MQELTLGFSPCPNDTFIFDALVNGRIDTNGISFKVVLEDVQTLNEWAKEGRLDISKVSYGTLPLLIPHYRLLNSGSALGKGVGPLLIARAQLSPDEIASKTIAIPGADTTAHLLFSMAFPQAQQKRFMVFHQVEEAVLSGAVDAGVIIHENRFTYQQKGLQLVADLGAFWEQRTNVPIPLGGIVARKSFDRGLLLHVDALIRQSLQMAFDQYPTISSYVRQHAQEMDEAVMRQHIDLYVNNYSLQLGEAGRHAVSTLLSIAGTAATDVFID